MPTAMRPQTNGDGAVASAPASSPTTAGGISLPAARRPGRAWSAVVLAGMAGIVLAACSSSPSTSSKSLPASTQQVVIGYENNGADPSLITIDKGYFKKELGPNVSTQIFSSGPVALGAIASGSLQFMCGIGIPPVLSAIAKGVPLVVVWNQERYTTDAGIVVKASSGINSLKDLEGKTIAIVTGSEASFELPALLAQAGVPVSSVHQLNMSPPDMRSAWSTGQIQAAIVWDPVFDALASDGGKVLATDASLPPTGDSYNICVANKVYVDANPPAAVDFVKAMQDGVAYWKAHPSSALSIMESEAGIDAATATKELAGYQIYTLQDQTTSQVLGSGSSVAASGTAQSLVNNWKELYDQGFLTSPPPANGAAYVDPVPAETALKASTGS
jgi:taurine ABC transporter substrate-binding protein